MFFCHLWIPVRRLREDQQAQDRDLDQPGGDVHHHRRLRLRRRRRQDEGEEVRLKQEHGVARHRMGLAGEETGFLKKIFYYLNRV